MQRRAVLCRLEGAHNLDCQHRPSVVVNRFYLFSLFRIFLNKIYKFLKACWSLRDSFLMINY